MRDTLRRHPRHVALAGLVRRAAGSPSRRGWRLAVAASRPRPSVTGFAAVRSRWSRRCHIAAPAGALAGVRRLAAIDRSRPRCRTPDQAVSAARPCRERERESFGTVRACARASGWLRVRLAGGADSPSSCRSGVPRNVAYRLARDRRRGRGAGSSQSRATGRRRIRLRGYLRRAGVHAILHADRVRAHGRPPRRPAGRRRRVRRARRARGRRRPGAAARARLRAGSSSGRTSDIPRADGRRLQASGLAHLLAVSGQNVTLLAVLAWPLLGGIRPRASRPALVRARADSPLRAADGSRPVDPAGGRDGRCGDARGPRGTTGIALVRAAARVRRFTLALDPRAWHGRRLAAQLCGGCRHLRAR